MRLPKGGPYDLDPVLNEMRDEAHLKVSHQVARLAILLDVNERTVWRMRERGLDEFEADTIAGRLGLHPTALWSDWGVSYIEVAREPGITQCDVCGYTMYDEEAEEPCPQCAGTVTHHPSTFYQRSA